MNTVFEMRFVDLKDDDALRALARALFDELGDPGIRHCRVLLERLHAHDGERPQVCARLDLGTRSGPLSLSCEVHEPSAADPLGDAVRQVFAGAARALAHQRVPQAEDHRPQQAPSGDVPGRWYFRER